MYHAPIIMNGTPYRVLPGLTIATLLRDRGLAPETVVVELNGCAMTPSETKATPLQSGDVLEVVSNVARGWCGTASPPGEEVFQS